MAGFVLPWFSAFGRRLIRAADDSAGRTLLDAQEQDDLLDAIAAESMVADRYIYGDGADSVALGTITADARLLLADADVPRLGTPNAWTEPQTITKAATLLLSLSATLEAGDGCIYINDSVGAANGDRYIRFGNSGNTTGTITYVTGNQTNYGTTSDPRLKNVTGRMDCEAALARVLAIKLHEGTWKADGSTFRGILSDELQQIVPVAVTGELGAVDETWVVIDGDGSFSLEESVVRTPDQVDHEDFGPLEKRIDRAGKSASTAEWHKVDERISPQMVDHSKLVPDMIAAMQWMMAEIVALKDEVATLKSERLTKSA